MNKFVSRGGIKLQAALDAFGIDAKGKIALDVGSSTGGFVDCLLQNGAAKVYAIDTAYGELAWKLRQDKRVIVMERTNILYFGQSIELVDLVTIDAGWTKLELMLPKIRQFIKLSAIIIALCKPQYETLSKRSRRPVLTESNAAAVKNMVIKNIQSLGFMVKETIDSPILGGSGNKEYLMKIIP